MRGSASPHARAPRLVLIGIAGMALAACQPTETPAQSSGSASPSPVVATAECAPTELRLPTGEIVDLNGEWGGGTWFTIPPSTGQRTFILQSGDCVWISISDDQFRASPTEGKSLLAQFFGHIDADFSVSGYLVTLFRWVDPFYYGEQAPVAPIRLVIEPDPDTGSLRLREDRVQGIEGPRCTSPEFFCPYPTVLYPISDVPAASPS
jgi:hypothetical protein